MAAKKVKNPYRIQTFLRGEETKILKGTQANLPQADLFFR